MIFVEVNENGTINAHESTVSDSVKYETVKFDFPKKWKGYTKTALFSNGDTVLSVILNGDSDLCTGEDECYIPHEVIKSPEFTVSVFGVSGDSVATTERAGIRVIQSGYGEGDEPSDPTPTEYQQLINLASETKQIAQSVRTDADNGLFKGDKGDTGAQGLKGDKGDKGDTGEQGIQGIQGDKGDKGDKGDAFTYSDFTPEQLAGLKGEKGDPGEVTLTYADNTFANALKSGTSGSALLIDDVSPVTHDMAVTVKSKNMIPYPYAELPEGEKIYNGITFTVSPDGSITANGTALDEIKLYLYQNTTGLLPGLKSGMSITGAKAISDISALDKIGVVYEYYDLSGTAHLGINLAVSSFRSTTVTDDWVGMGIYLSISSGTEISDLTVKPQLELGSTATAYTPYVDLAAVKLMKQGKNLIPFPYQGLKTSTTNGIDFTVYEDGSILINGTATSSTTKYLYTFATGLLGLKSGVTISCNKNASDNTQQANVYFICNYYDSAGKMQMGIQMSTNASSKKTITDDWKGLGIYLNIPKGKTINNLLIKPQIVIGDTADDYEPYITPTMYTPNADGTVEGVSSLYPNTTLTTDKDGVLIDCEYNRDINKAFAELQAAIISLGGNV